jgi:ribose transport system permease protein
MIPNQANGPLRRWLEMLGWCGPYLGLLIVIALFSLLIRLRNGPEQMEVFLSLGTLKLVTVHAAIPAMVGLGMTILMISGGIDLSVGYVVSLTTVTIMLTYRWAAEQAWAADYASFLAIGAGLATGALFGLANGVLITRSRVVPFVVTLGMMGVARGLAQYLTKGTPVAFPDPAHPPEWVSWAAAIEPDAGSEWMVFGPAVWAALLMGVVVALMLRFTVLGRYCYAIGSNEATAKLCGIRVDRTKVLLYTLAGLITGFAGVLQFARTGHGSHDIQAGLEMEVIAAVVIGGGSLTGGEGTVSGTLAGALLLHILDEGCSKLQLPQDFRYIIIGGIIIGVAALNSWRQRRLR